jgi:GDP-4-dehydro-6-deoxy-D-mannose reductase
MSETPKVLITGINGFVGQHMGRYLIDQDIHVVGTGRRASSLVKDKRLHYISCNLLHSSCLDDLITQQDPDYIIHLAAENHAPSSWSQPKEILQMNVFGTVNLLESIRKASSPKLKRLLVIGSSHEYGVNSQKLTTALTENTPLGPTSPYGWSKQFQTQVSQMYAGLYQVPVLIARTFNLMGPGSSGGVCAKIAKQVVEMEKGMRLPKLQLGRLDIQRDLLDVRDAVTAYWALLQMNNYEAGDVYNVCQGTAFSIGQLAALFKQYSNIDVKTHVDSSLVRKDDPTWICGDYHKLNAATGWQPSFSMETSIQDMLDYFRRGGV